MEALFLFNYERGNVVDKEKQTINNTINSVVAKISEKINPSTTIEQLYDLLKEEINNTKSKTTDITKQRILEKFKKDIVQYSTKLLERTVEAITATSNSASNFYNSLPISILNELNLDSTRLQILPNNTLQELSVEHLIKLPIKKLITLNIKEEKLKLLPPKTLQDLLATKTQELKGNIELKGNEGYLMINGEFIKTDEFLSGFEFEKDSFQPIDAQYANEIQKIMYGNIQPQNLDTLEHNLSHSEQRMMLYILQQLQKGEKIDEIVMFTGRKCCPVCHEALPKFMKYIKDNYKDLVPDKIIVYDFWNKKEYDEDRAKRGYYEKDYYAYGSKDGVNYKSVFDTSLNKTEEKHLSKFVEKINKDRVKVDDKKFNKETGQRDIPVVLIGNSQYTIESLKGNSNTPIMFSVEELEKIYNEKKIKAEQDEVFKLINKVNSLNKELEQIKNNKIINAEIKQLLNDILQHNKRYSQ